MSPGRSISPFINDVFGSIPSPFDMLNQLDTESRALTAACDVVESDSTYTISLEAPVCAFVWSPSCYITHETERVRKAC